MTAELVCDHGSLLDERGEDLELPGMTAAELRCLREFLGVPPVWLAERLKIRERTLHRWEAGVAPIPDGVADEVEELAKHTETVVDALIEEHSDPDHDGVLVTYRTDEDYRDAGFTEFPASWHRAIAARVADAVPDLTLVYYGDPPTEEL